MERNRETFCAIGVALFGCSWQTDMARALDVSDRSVRHWVSGRNGIRPGVWDDVEALCRKRSEDLERIANNIADSHPV